MIGTRTFPVDAWSVREPHLHLNLLPQTESVFALSNGHIGLRGNLDEGDPHAIPGTYLNSFYETRVLPYAEAGYGYPEDGQTVVDVTNGKLIRLLVDDEPFDVRYGELLQHERTLDLRAGTLVRCVDWVSPAGKRVKIRSTRLVSFAQRAVAAICYEVEAVDAGVRVTVQSELVANEDQPDMSGDPRVSAALRAPLVHVTGDIEEHGALLVHRTRSSGLLMAAGMDHVVEGPGSVQEDTVVREDWARTTVLGTLQPGETLKVVKFLAYGWSSVRSVPAVRDQVGGALTGARYSGWEGLLQSQRAYLDEFWDASDVEVEGDGVVQQAVRFGLFHVLQAGARAEQRAIPAKGLTGPGYDGHTFWDTEGFVLATLTATVPDAAADALRWRYSTLDLARERARALGLQGATFPWRTIRGQECSAYWPAGTAAFHVNAVIAYAVERYRLVTGDLQLEIDCGLEMLVETARLWMSLGHHDSAGAWHIGGVTGPDEYTALVDDNVFTNLLAARNLRAAADGCARHPQLAEQLLVSPAERTAWRDAAGAVHIPYDEALGVHPQSERFTQYDEWDFAATKDDYPLLLTTPYFQIYRKQVVKQADLVLAMHWCPDAFDDGQRARNVDYYEQRTVRDSTLSACTQATMCARVGHLDLAHDYLHEAALIDLRDLHGNAGDGVHMASLAGAWSALVDGFGGLQVGEGTLSLDPQLPTGLHRLAFRVRWHGMRLLVEVTGSDVTLTLRDGEGAALDLVLCGEAVTVTAGAPVTRAWTRRPPLLPRPTQPIGREPVSRD